MRHHIEHAKIKYDRVTVTGWLVGDTLHTETQLWVEDGHGARIPCQVERTLRDDVTIAIWGVENVKPCGFRVRFEAPGAGRFVLCLSDGVKTVRCKTDAAQTRRLGRIPDDFKEIIKIKLGKGEGTADPVGDRRRDAIRCGNSVDLTDPANQSVKFSVVVPAYNTEPEHLADMIESIRQQTYGNWELCIADGSPESMLERFQAVIEGRQDPFLQSEKGAHLPNQNDAESVTLPQLTVGLAQTLVEYLTDPRVKYEHLSENLGISGNTNAALALADGEFVVMVDHDDVLEADALEQVARVIDAHPQADFIYSDSDLTDHDNLYNYNHLCKPRWSQEMLYSANYITHLSVVRTSLLHRIGGWKKEYDGAQDWDLFLRIGEATREIYHIPAVLYHWRAAASSTARDIGAKPYAKLAQLRAVQDHLDRRGLPGKAAFVDEQSTCIRVMWDSEYLAAMNPEDVLIFTEDGVKLSQESAAELRAWALQPDMGIIGARVIADMGGESGRIASQGITLEIGANMPCYGMVPGTASFGGHTDWYQDHVAPDPVCWAISRDLWEQLGGLDDSWGELALMDLCLRSEKAGYRCMVTPFAQVDLREIEGADGNGTALKGGKCLTQRYIPEMVSAHVKLYKSHFPLLEDRPQ